MKLHPYLILSGQAAKALKFYENALGLKIGYTQTYKESPMPTTLDQENWLIHGELLLHNRCFMMVADSPDSEKVSSNVLHLSLNFDEESTTRQAFENLAIGGRIIQPLAHQFWGALYGQLVDKFGVYWMVNCDLKSNN